MQPISPSPSLEPVAVDVSSQVTGACTTVTITQTDGTEITLPCHPERIIVTNSNAAEMMIAIGAGDKIVGVTQSTTNVSYIMEKIPQAENIGDWQIPNVEKILALHPDIVIVYASSKPKNMDQLTSANITLVYLDCFRLTTLAHDARALGTLTGHKNEAEVYARLVEDTVADVTAKVKTIPEDSYPAVYSESYMDYTAAGRGSGSDELLTLAGGRNIAEDVASSSAKISTEWVVARQPSYIFKVISSGNSKPFPETHATLVNRTGWDTISAVKNDRVYLFANDVQYGPRAYIGLVYTAQLLHPDDFRDLHPRAMLDEYASRYVSGTNRTGMVYP
ncbi:ABC transporter substrate-binding protein [Methanoregula sp.]|uniref:ABC transporter substrate-binding protein n=1 Tax=Methanoregula sp. TaxID=2052170 RepID=UPI00260CC9B6|nr:ABC transporter substrate-binding protein [Methanoregula sp.]MDD5143634.1 ABC transporter substrate-binding protein [Methanoregula sp.]